MIELDNEKIKILTKHKCYATRQEAEANRNRQERIYYDPKHGYYIIRPRKRDFWNIKDLPNTEKDRKKSFWDKFFGK